jgi:hypothetical protein
MSRVTEIARILGCTESNVCYLLRRGRIKGKKTSAGWMVSDEAVQEYLASPKVQLHPIKLKLHKGQKFGYWTVLNPDAERSKSGQRTALVRCICGKTDAHHGHPYFFAFIVLNDSLSVLLLLKPNFQEVSIDDGRTETTDHCLAPGWGGVWQDSGAAPGFHQHGEVVLPTAQSGCQYSRGSL